MGERSTSTLRRNSSDRKPILFITKYQKRAKAPSASLGPDWGPQLRLAVRRNSSMASSSLRNKDSLQDARFQSEATAEATTTTTATTATTRRRRSFQYADGRGRAGGQLVTPTHPAHFNCLALVFMVAAGLLLVCANIPTPALADDDSTADTKAALEAELNSILQQQELSPETNSKLLSEAIISRLMLGNLTDINAQEEGPNESNSFDAPSLVGEAGPNTDGGLDANRLRRLISYLQNYEPANAAVNGQTFGRYPVLPAIQAATIKRATVKMGNYLRQQQQQQHGGQRQVTGYRGVNNFDFGLGKRPDSSVSGNILRFGDSASAGGHMAAVSGSGLGKRPSAHRYDFGLGKRVASPSYPRYDFGLGKRAPSRVRYDFGLGK